MGRVVHYKLSDRDVRSINQQHARQLSERAAEAVTQDTEFLIPAAAVGDVVSGTVTGINTNGTINIKCDLNGPGSLWVSNRAQAPEGEQPEMGQWFWPPRA